MEEININDTENTETKVESEEKSNTEELPQSESNHLPLEQIYSERNFKPQKSEHFGDVLVAQIALCMVISLAVTVINIAKPGLARDIAFRFRDMTGGQPEEFFKKAVSEVLKFINA